MTARAFVVAAARVFALICLFFLSLFVHVFYAEMGWLAVVYGVAVVAVLCAIVAAIQLPMYWRLGRISEATIEVKDGIVIVRTYANNIRFTMNLAELRWRCGNRREATLPRVGLAISGAAVLLVYPVRIACFRVPLRLACGVNDDLREVWQGFLTLARVRQLGNAGATWAN